MEALTQGATLRMCMDVAFHEDVQDPMFLVHLRNEAGTTIFNTSSDRRPAPTGRFAAGERARVTVELENWLATGRYMLTPSVSRAGSGADTYDRREDLASIVVHGTLLSDGVIEIPHHMQLERS